MTLALPWYLQASGRSNTSYTFVYKTVNKYQNLYKDYRDSTLMCGIFGIIGSPDAAAEIYVGMLHLQHRGQDAAGLMVQDTSSPEYGIRSERGKGWVTHLFDGDKLAGMAGSMGIGHTRYPTAGCGEMSEVQPFFVQQPDGIGMGFNGNIINYQQLKKELREEQRIYLRSQSDGEALLHLFAEGYKRKEGAEAIFSAVEHINKKCVGAYSVVGMISNKGVFAFKDPNGIKPLKVGQRQTSKGVVYAFASESIALSIQGFENVRSLEPGEVIFVDANGNYHSRILEQRESAPCSFEWVYFSTVESEFQGKSVYMVRKKLGEELAAKVKKKWPDLKVDVVIPVPDTSRPAAAALANSLGVRYDEGLVKNRYVGRTFIMPHQQVREQALELKLKPIDHVLKGKNVMVVDDSIVRGTTSKRMVKLLRNSGAEKVYLLSTFPPIKHPCYYGIDFTSRGELVAADRDFDEIEKEIGADKLIYMDVEGLEKAIGQSNMCSACLTGKYPTPVDSADSLSEQRQSHQDQFDKENSIVLVVGNGAREHVITESLAKDSTVYAYMNARNPGIAKLAKDTRIGSWDNVDDIVEYAKEIKATLVVVGPELPLSAGVVDALENGGIPCFGPVKELAQLETSKSFTRSLLSKYAINASPAYRVFNSSEGLHEYLLELGEYVLKPDGLTGGKGVKVKGEHFQTEQEAIAYCEEVLAGHGKIVVEEKLIGEEFSLMSITDGKTVIDMPAVQDHKRAFDGDQGPNTGGMGSYSDADHSLPFLTKEDLDVAHETTVQVLDALKKETGKEYKGVMYGGFIKTKNGVKLIEYNARFGDPEAMNVLPLLKTSFRLVCQAVVEQRLHELPLQFEQKATVCKYVVPEEYPGKSEQAPIVVPEMSANVYYAAVDERDGQLVTTGSRAVATVGIAPSLEEAQQIAEEGASKIEGKVRHRTDIGTSGLIQKRIEHVRAL